jgi:Trk K+ transport system NAD-binding subunit
MTTNIVIGILAFAFGIYTAIVRVKNPEKLGKYKAMIDKFGNKGKILHIISYTVLPIFIGIVLIVSDVFFR